MMSTNLIINTNLTDGISEDILSGIIAQLSDGMWENSKSMEHYWPFVEIEMVDNEVCVVIYKPGSSKRFSYGRVNDCCTNWFTRWDKLNSDPMKIKKWFASKIKAIVNENAKDYPNLGIKFSPKCDVALDYMSNSNGINHKVCEAYNAYRSLCAV